MATLAGVGVARYCRVSGVEAAPLQGESILYHPESKRFFMLNTTAAFVWGRLGEPSGAEDLAASLCEAFDGVEPETARGDVEVALEQLVELGLVKRVGDTREDEAN